MKLFKFWNQQENIIAFLESKQIKIIRKEFLNFCMLSFLKLLSFLFKKKNNVCGWEQRKRNITERRERERERISKGGSGKKQGLKYYQYGWDSNWKHEKIKMFFGSTKWSRKKERKREREGVFTAWMRCTWSNRWHDDCSHIRYHTRKPTSRTWVWG